MLKGKTALVTGSTSGIGLAIARALAAQGANVTINGFGDKAAIEKERAGIEKEFGVKAVYSPADMTKPAEIADMVHASREDLRLARHPGQQCRHPVSSRRSRNSRSRSGTRSSPSILSSAFHAIRAAVPGMKSRKWGRIINTASAHSLVASPFKVAYVSAKHGLAGLTKTVALEARDLRHHRQLHQPRLRLDAAGREADSRHDEGARHDRRSRSSATCCWRRSRPRNSSPSTRSPRSPSIFAPMRRRRSPAPIFRSTAAGPRREPVRLA